MTQPARRLADTSGMANQSKGRGNGRPVDLTVRILRQLRAEMRERFASLEQATASGFRQVTARLENLRDVSGERWRDHERRLRALESRRR